MNGGSLTEQKTKVDMVKNYDESSIKSLDWREHIRLRPGMYIGKLGDGSSSDDGIYILIKEIIDNSIDEFVMGHGKKIDIELSERSVRIRDYGRGIPLGKLVDCVSKINTGAKYDSEVFKKSVGLNGVGTKAANALSESFRAVSYRDKKMKEAYFEKGLLVKDPKPQKNKTSEPDGTLIEFSPDPDIFESYRYRPAHLDELLANYAYLNQGLTLTLNGKSYHSTGGLRDLLEVKLDNTPPRYPLIHLTGKDIEVCLTHSDESTENYYSFVNGQYTVQGGTHQAAVREALVKVLREHFKRSFDPADIRAGVKIAISVRIEEPVFESQTKTRLGSQYVRPQKVGEETPRSIRAWVNEFLLTELDNYLHQNKETSDALLRRILEAERERRELSGFQKLAREQNKKSSLFNKKLRDCRVHLTSKKHPRRLESSIFITEGDSASGSLTSARDSDTQAVFSLRGKPLNTHGLTKKAIYENEELNLLQHAVGLIDGPEGLRYNKIILATDADVDGMHIRLLLLTFFLKFFPEVVEDGHLYILVTPLFRVRNKTKTIYCYSEDERLAALDALGGSAEITRFKGLGEIDPAEFEAFIGSGMRLDHVDLHAMTTEKDELLQFYMGKNTPERKSFIIENLRATEAAQKE